MRFSRAAPLLFAVVGLGIGAGCDHAPVPWSDAELALLRSLWIESLPPPSPDPSNRVADEPRAADLGQQLFFDPRLSGNGAVACATCHQPARHFTDGLAHSQAIGTTRRNAPSLIGAAFSPWQYWDGRKDSLWSQALSPLEDPNEHGGNRMQYARLVANDPAYRRAYEALFGALPDLSDASRFPAAAAPVEAGEETGPEEASESHEEVLPPDGPAMREPTGWLRWLIVASFCAFVLYGLSTEALRLNAELGGVGTLKALVRSWLFPILIGVLLLIGVAGRAHVYESMIEGAREGLQVAVKIVPYLVAILAAVAMFRASGALDLVIDALNPYTSRIGVPAEVLPMALLRPLSGSGAFGVMAEILETHGPDTFVGYLASTLQGSTETTFYVLTLYCGAAGIRSVRHALAAPQ